MLPYLINTNKSDSFELSYSLLEVFGLKERINYKPNKKSIDPLKLCFDGGLFFAIFIFTMKKTLWLKILFI